MGKQFPRSWLLLAVLLCGGCLQIESHVKLHEDGSATITERVCFSCRLLDLGDKEGAPVKLSFWLSKEAAEKRVSLLGKHVRLTSHKVTETAEGGKESVAVYEIPNIADFQYVSPFLMFGDYAKKSAAIQCQVAPS